MVSFFYYILDSEKALEDKIKNLLDMLPNAQDPDAIKAEIKNLEDQLEELRNRRTF